MDTKFCLFIFLCIILILIFIYLTLKPLPRGSKCSTNNQCQSNLVCLNQTCVFNPSLNLTVMPSQICYIDSECPSNYYCSAAGVCLVDPQANISQPCKNDQDCTVGNYCACNRTCQVNNFDSTYFNGSNNPVYLQRVLENFELTDTFMGSTLPNSDIITFNPNPTLDMNGLIYNSQIKTLARPAISSASTQPAGSNDLLVLDKFGILINDTQQNTNMVNNNEFYFRPIDPIDIADNDFNFDVITDVNCMIDQYGNVAKIFTTDDDQPYVAVCDDAINYENPLNCSDGMKFYANFLNI